MARPIFILGQTGSGKHAAAEAVADRLGLPLVSIDSMKVYRGMDIGTAKPRRAYRLMDICDPSENYSAGRFVRDARALLAELPRPVFVGGTALYYKALAYGLFDGPGADPELRRELEAWPVERLRGELLRVDPKAAEKIHPNDVRRSVRAIEVYRKTGAPLSASHTHFGTRTLEADVFGFRREDIRERLAVRTRKMLESGLVEEVKRLLEKPWSREGRSAVGYREVIGFIEGEYDAAEMERLINRNSVRLARHQWMWFKRMPEIRWVKDAAELCGLLSS